MAVWLSEAPRTLVLDVYASFSELGLLRREFPEGARASSAAKTAGGVTIQYLVQSCAQGGMGCLAGVVTSPVAAVAGAGVGFNSEPPGQFYRPLSEAKGGAELSGFVVPQEVADHLAKAVLAVATKTRHSLRSGATADAGWATMHLGVAALDLGVVDAPKLDNPETRLELKLHLVIDPPYQISTFGSSKDFIYASENTHPVSEWSSDSGKVFREEMAKAIDLLALATIAEIEASPGLKARLRMAGEKARHEQIEADVAASKPAHYGDAAEERAPSTSTSVSPR